MRIFLPAASLRVALPALKGGPERGVRTEGRRLLSQASARPEGPGLLPSRVCAVGPWPRPVLGAGASAPRPAGDRGSTWGQPRRDPRGSAWLCGRSPGQPRAATTPSFGGSRGVSRGRPGLLGGALGGGAQAPGAARGSSAPGAGKDSGRGAEQAGGESLSRTLLSPSRS